MAAAVVAAALVEKYSPARPSGNAHGLAARRAIGINYNPLVVVKKAPNVVIDHLVVVHANDRVDLRGKRIDQAGIERRQVTDSARLERVCVHNLPNLIDASL